MVVLHHITKKLNSQDALKNGLQTKQCQCIYQTRVDAFGLKIPLTAKLKTVHSSLMAKMLQWKVSVLPLKMPI